MCATQYFSPRAIRAGELSQGFWIFGIVSAARKIRWDVELKLTLAKTNCSYRRSVSDLFLISFPGVTDAPVCIAHDPRANGHGSCGGFLANWNDLDVKRNWFAFGATQCTHLFQVLRGVRTTHDLFEKS